VTAISSNRNKIFWSSCSKSLGWEKTACREKKGTKEKGFLLESVVFADKRKFSGGCFFWVSKEWVNIYIVIQWWMFF